MNKKAQGLPMNVVILGIIVIVVLVIVLVFFVGGTAQVQQKINQLLGINTAGEQVAIAQQACSNSCDSVINESPERQKASVYCNAAIVVDHDANPSTPAEKRKCGVNSNADVRTNEAEDKKGIVAGTADLGVNCNIAC